MDRERLKMVAFLVFFIGLFVLTFLVFKPFLGILVLAITLSILLHPLYKKFVRIFGGSKNFVAMLFVVIALFFLIMPVVFLGLQIFDQAKNFFSLSHAGQGQYLQAIQQGIETPIRNFVPNFTLNIADSFDKGIIIVSENLSSVLSQTTFIFFEMFFLLFALFFFLRDGEKMLASFIALSPFEEEQNKEIIHSVHRTITSVVRGTLFVGLIRLLLIVAVFYLFAIPGALLWGSVGGLVALVPGVGTPLIVVLAVLYFLSTGNILFAVGMGSFGILIGIIVDNMLSAHFFGKGLDAPSIFVLFSILGGIIFFGPLGFIFGPIVLSLFVSAIDMYKILILKTTR